MMSYKLLAFFFLYLLGNSAYAQTEYEVEYTYDTTKVNVFEGVEKASFKLDYYHSEGYSSGARYWYEIIIVDSLLILNFKSPDIDDWNYVSYQKQVELSDSALSSIKSLIKSLKIGQKRKGIPRPLGSGYGSEILHIEWEELSISGGATYMCVGGDDGKEDYHSRIKEEKKQSSSISGDYEALFLKLTGLFDSLQFLLNDKDDK